MATYPYTIAGSEYQRTEQGEEVTLVWHVDGLSAAAPGKMIEAATASGLPRFGARHPTRSDLLVSDIRAAPVAEQPSMAQVTVRYRSEGLRSTAGQIGATSVSMSTETLAEETIYDINDALMKTVYVRFTAAGLNFARVTDTQVHRVAIEKPTFALNIERIEDGIGFAKATTFAGKTNTSRWQGQPAKTWLVRISSSEAEGGLHRVRYDAVFNPETWQATVLHVQDGVIPEDIRGNNGSSTYDVYETIDFNQLQLPRVL